ncbi:LysR family transcriptional regulator [Robertmurraya massiliosenegalensis]|uniref:LysR family transcriptional regulator n=1 Tax=Robertmurraya massiliosenegalensis TaxID=1287657 RepID=UPI000312C607|nr:LysR family transcriptional regulator [Robertmurraya massiliosenegalensis]
MELRQLEYFVEVGRLKSFTHAAESLHVSQPSISNSVHKLEHELGVKLLERTTKSVALTPKGDIFLTRIIDILSNIDDIKNEITDSDNRVVKIGLPPMIGAQMFPNIYKEFKRNHPLIEFDVIEKGSVAIRNLIEKDELEMGFIILPEHSEKLEMMPLVQDQLVICMPKNHPLRRKKSLQYSELINEKFIILTEEYVHHNIFLNRCFSSKVEPNIIFTSDKVETVKAMVAKGLGLSLLMNVFVREHHELIAVPLKERININIGLAWKKGKVLSSDCKKVIEFISDYYHEELKNKVLK